MVSSRAGLCFFLACRLDFSVSKKNAVLQLVSVQVCKGSQVAAEADKKDKLKKKFCLLHKKNKGSCIVMPNVLNFKKSWQVTGKKSAKHFAKQQKLKTFGKEGNIANSCEK